MITDDLVEIGWPYAALPNPKIKDKREASQPAQDEALRSIVGAVGGSRDTIYLTSVDEKWKAKQDQIDPLGAEQVSLPPSPSPPSSSTLTPVIKFWGIANLGLLKKP